MGSTAHSRADADEPSGNRNPSPRAVDWFWRPWYAKVLWMVAGLYWVALYGMLLLPAEQLNRSVAGAMVLLIIVFNPVTVMTILGYGFLKAKVACGDWIVIPGVPLEHSEWQRREREAGYLNPVDIRSGYLHQQYMDRSRRHPTGHVGP
jgi:hypothetical protein